MPSVLAMSSRPPALSDRVVGFWAARDVEKVEGFF
jgi:hypothetical protein